MTARKKKKMSRAEAFEQAGTRKANAQLRQEKKKVAGREKKSKQK